MEELESKEDDFSPVVKLLESHIAEYLALGEKMEIEVEVEDVLDVVDRALFKAKGQVDAGPEGDDPKAFFLDGLFEELSGEPENLYERSLTEEGEEQFAPMSHEAWTRCLTLLRGSVEEMSYEV